MPEIKNLASEIDAELIELALHNPYVKAHLVQFKQGDISKEVALSKIAVALVRRNHELENSLVDYTAKFGSL